MVWTMMMKTNDKPGFLRLFLGGFVAGAALLIGVQTVQADQPNIIASARATTR